MKQTEKTHWTENTDTLERFVLDRLDPGERSELENHLRTCNTCHEAVRAEQQIAAGVRRLGRDELKMRLKQHIENKAAPRIPWRQIASVAAVVAITVSVGVYSGWFVSEEQYPERIAEELKTTEEPASIPPSTSEGMAGKDIAESEVITTPEPPSTAGARQAIPSEDKRAKIGDMAVGRTETGTYADKKQAERILGATEKDDRIDAIALEETKPEDEISRMANEADMAGSESLWIAGNILLQTTGAFDANLKAEEPKELSKRSTVDRYRADHSQELTRKNVDGQTITLSQRPLSDLPAVQQRQAKVPGNTVQTLMERTEEGLNLTLYLDPLVSPAELENASIQAIRDDSLIVNLPSQSIGYNILGGWGARKVKAQTQE